MQKTRGISLIVLVITIIVMIILAGATILTLNNTGIIEKASDVVEETNLATVKELAQMAWADAYASGERIEERLKAAVDKSLEDNEVDTTKYVVKVTTKDVTVVLKGPWIQTGEEVTNKELTIKVGEKINYTATGTDYEGDWKVLGASEYGELLIMSDSDVTIHILGYKSTTTDSAQRLKESQEAWLNGAGELDAICEAYGEGKGATGARSVTVEDINRVTGYDKTTYSVGQLYEYGNEVTYSYNGTTKPAYYGSNGKTGTLSYVHSNGFHFYNGIEFVHVNDLTTGTSGTTFATLKSDYYYYWAGDLALSEEASLLIFGEYDADMDEYSNYYWLASPCVYTIPDDARFGMRGVGGGFVSYYRLWNSGSSTSYREFGVRAVVSLDTNVNISANTAGGWNINM